MEIGEAVKVWLPGETPWAVVEEIHSPGLMEARIDNNLVGEWSEAERSEWAMEHFGAAEPLPVLHDYKYGDRVLFEKMDGVWMAKFKVALA